MVINKYNKLITKYNNLINNKISSHNKRVNSESKNMKNSLLINNNKISERSNATLNNSNEKKYNINLIKNIKNGNKINNKKTILIQENNKNINLFDNNYIKNLRKENDFLKKIIKTYKNISFNNFKKPINTLKESNYFINKRRKRKSKKKDSVSKDNSRDHSYIMKNYKNKKIRIKSNLFNKSQILLPKNTTNNSNIKNNFIEQPITNDSSMIITKNKKLTEIPHNFKNFNTINNNYNKNNIIKKNNTYIKRIKGNGSKNEISNQRMMNKLKVKCKDYLFNEKLNNIKTNNNLSKEKIGNKLTPKNIIKNNISFFAHTNYNIKNKCLNNNKLKYFQQLDLDNNFININNNDNQNNTETNYYDDNINNKEKRKIENNNINNESNNKNNNLIIHRNTESKMGNKFRLIKEFKTETENFYSNLQKDIFPNDNELSSKNLEKIKINKKNIFLKKSQNSFRSTFNNKNQNLNEISDNDIFTKRKNKSKHIMNNSTITKSNKKKLIINNNIFNNNSKNKNKNSLKQFPLNPNKKNIEENGKLSTLKNKKMKKTLNNTINNISNFNNCNYIYLFNNGDKFVKINKQFKA